MSKSVPLVQQCQTCEILRHLEDILVYFEGCGELLRSLLKVKVLVSDFNFRNIYPGICSSTFVKSDSGKPPSFRSPSEYKE